MDRAVNLRFDRRERKLRAPVAYHPPVLGRAAARAAAIVLSSPSYATSRPEAALLAGPAVAGPTNGLNEPRTGLQATQRT
jgi:hypothetical protein